MNRLIQPDIHPDADSLNAFVERVLPEAEHERVLEHLAGCARCRNVVYLTRQMGAIEAAPAPLPQVKTEPRRGWWSPVFAHWRIAWIPAAALAAIGGVLVWVHVRSAQPAVDIARVASTQAALANTQPPSQATGRSVASPPPSEPATRRAEAKNPIEAAGLKEKKGIEMAQAPNLRASQGVLGEMRPENPYVPAAPLLQPRPAMSAPAQVAPEPPLTNTQWQTSQQVQMATSQAMSAKSSTSPPSSGMRTVHGGVMAPPTASPKPLAAATQQTSMQYEMMPQPVNGLAALQLTKRLKLPSGLNTLSSAAMLNRLLAVDSAGTLFLSTDAGKHWDAVPVQWTGKAIEVHAEPRAHSAYSDAGGGPVPVASDSASPSEAASIMAPPPAPVPGIQPAGAEAVPPVPAMLFRLVNDRHRTWLSTDGKTWREQPQNPSQ